MSILDRGLDPLRKTVMARTQDAGRRLVALGQAIPDRQLDRLMNGPARRPIVETIFLLMPRYLNRARATGLNLAVRWRVTSPAQPDRPDVYDLVIADRRCRVHRGEEVIAPLVTITLDAGELLRLAIGRSNPMQSYFAGRLQLRGDMMQASRLTSIFNIPTTHRA